MLAIHCELGKKTAEDRWKKANDDAQEIPEETQAELDQAAKAADKQR